MKSRLEELKYRSSCSIKRFMVLSEKSGYSNRTIMGKFTVDKTTVSLAITTEKEGQSNNTFQEWEYSVSFENTLGSRVELVISGDTSTSEYYTGFKIYYPVWLTSNVSKVYEYFYSFSDYGDREEYGNSAASKFDIRIDGVVIQSLKMPFSSHHNKIYESDKYKITITVVEK